LLIRGAETAVAFGADEQALKVNCSMAQAFETPRGNRTAHHRTLATAQDGLHKVPSNAFQIAAPGPIQRRTGHWNMGSVSDRRKRINAALPRPKPGRIPVRQSRQG
jgi:hypothetical protein